MVYEHILLVQVDGIATIKINRPEVMNALAPQTVAELIDAVDRVSVDSTARVLLLTGQGRAFCAGADLKGWGQDPTTPLDAGAPLDAGFNPLLERLRRLRIPFVAAVNGVAAGAGCGYALAADFVLAARSSYFVQSFVGIGLIPDVGATWLLPRLVGKARATAMMMLGERISAEQAFDYGMIYRVVEDAELESAASTLARRLATGPTVSYGLLRQGIADCLEVDLTEALSIERRNQTIAGQSDDHHEGVKAFLEKRQPKFLGH